MLTMMKKPIFKYILAFKDDCQQKFNSYTVTVLK